MQVVDPVFNSSVHVYHIIGGNCPLALFLNSWILVYLGTYLVYCGYHIIIYVRIKVDKVGGEQRECK